MLAALLQTTSLLSLLKRELRRVSPEAKIEKARIREVLLNEVLVWRVTSLCRARQSLS